MKKIITFLFIALTAINISAFSADSNKTENRSLKNFNAVKVSSGIDLYLKMGDSENVEVVADDDDIDRIITEVRDGTLHIYMKNNSIFNFNFGSRSKKVYVTVKELNMVDASAGSDVASENVLTGDNLEIEASSGSDIKLDVIYKNLSLDVSSGSDAKIAGKTKNFSAEASSGSDINAKDLESVICKARASSGSDISVRVSDEIYARASSGSDINYYGNPQIKDINESSGGDISHR
jgi:hypothetical protein